LPFSEPPCLPRPGAKFFSFAVSFPLFSFCFLFFVSFPFNHFFFSREASGNFLLCSFFSFPMLSYSRSTFICSEHPFSLFYGVLFAAHSPATKCIRRSFFFTVFPPRGLHRQAPCLVFFFFLFLAFAFPYPSPTKVQIGRSLDSGLVFFFQTPRDETKRALDPDFFRFPLPPGFPTAYSQWKEVRP